MLAPSVDENGDVTTPARLALAALERLIAPLDYGIVRNDYRVIFQFCSDIEIRIRAAHDNSEGAKTDARQAHQRVMQLDEERKQLTSLLHDCQHELAALTTSARAVCNRLNDLDPSELRDELNALQTALAEKRVRQVEHLMQYCIYTIELNRVLKRMFHKLGAQPKLTDKAIKWVFEQLKRSERPWWKLEIS